jgi:MarR family transcriptional regulator, organic hydroperoxide resistance regulator
MKVAGSPGSDATRASRDGQVSSDPAREAWWLMLELLRGHKRRLAALSHEFELAPMQLHALRLLEPGREMPMSALADSLQCDASNVTGIVDRLESRGLIERRDAPTDRRLRLLAITPEGERLRRRVVERMSEPPPPIAALSEARQRTLRDVLRAALDR